MHGITKRFGALVANDHVDLRVPSNTIHAIVGENGAGKSTIMKILYGFYQADEGEILVDGKRCDINSPHDAIAIGLGMVHQHFMLVPPMTVLENIVLGAEPGRATRIDFTVAEEQVRRLTSDFGFDLNPKQLVSDLSVGQQQRVELLKALYRGARILILDEPTAVLTPQEVDEFFKILRAMRDGGKTIIIITHKLSEVLSLSDNVTIMRDGKVVGEKRTAETNAAELARLMVGREVLLRVEKTPAKAGEPILEVRDLRLKRTDGEPAISFDVRAGEIVGIAGIEGNGQTELIEILAGLRSSGSGTIQVAGKYLQHLSARRIRENGVAHIPEDRHARGLLLQFDLAENTILGTHYRSPAAPKSSGLLDFQAISEKARRLIHDYDVRPPKPELPARALSGGNQQKLIIGREFDLHPRLLLVSQPTRGVDIGAIEFIHRKLIELRDSGVAILLVSAELEEVLSLADRILVMYRGGIVGEVEGSSADASHLGLMMTGAST